MICRGCKIDRKLIKAHIIPESFFRAARDESGQLNELSDKKTEFPKRRPIGNYDKNILCRECEDKLSPADDYGQKILLNTESTYKRYEGRSYYQINNIDGELFRRFLVSIIWRCSISKLDFYRHIRLGPFEDEAKRVSFGESPKHAHSYSYLITKIKESPTSRVIPNPSPIRYKGINYVQVFLTGYHVSVKVDSREDNAILPIVLDGFGTLYMLDLPFEYLTSFDKIRRIARMERGMSNVV